MRIITILDKAIVTFIEHKKQLPKEIILSVDGYIEFQIMNLTLYSKEKTTFRDIPIITDKNLPLGEFLIG